MDKFNNFKWGVSDIAFIARDGYLLKEIFSLLYPDNGCKLHYVYAPRILSVLLQEEYKKNERQDLLDGEREVISSVYGLKEASEDEKEKYISGVAERYRQYLSDENFGDGTILVVDASSSNLSSQKLIQNYALKNTLGCYWFVQQSVFTMDYQIMAYQKEHFTVIESPDLFELIFKSAESSVKRFSLENGIEFNEINADEQYRIEHFKYLEQGVMDFVNALITKGLDILPKAETINSYLNRYCTYPVPQERKYIEYGRASGGIGNTKWTPVRVYVDKKSRDDRRLFFVKIKKKIVSYPKLYVFLRNIYHKVRYRN